MSAERVLGMGVDLVENVRMRHMLARWGNRFKDKVFRPLEQKYADSKAFPAWHYAGRFAVKEAVSKAFGTGVGPEIGLLDVEVVRDPSSGAPSVRLVGKAREFARLRGVTRILVSLAHTRNYAVAQALVLGRCSLARGRRGAGRRRS
jgi:holo-[acyl-carrier protein] synthase